jgi:hypothetical protein
MGCGLLKLGRQERTEMLAGVKREQAKEFEGPKQTSDRRPHS